MKITAASLGAFVASAAAFSPSNSKNNKNVKVKTIATTTTNAATAKKMDDRPIFSPPAILDGSMAGDFGFDPLNLATNQQDLNLYREAEIRHSRLAMLAVVGWPLSELWQSSIASKLDLPSLIRPNDLAPAVLNGNISDIAPTFFVAALTLGAMIEAHTWLRKETPRFIGDIGFDPFKAYPSDPLLQRQIQEAELTNGRLAMLAITAFAVQEAVQNVGIIDSTPQFF
jgi:hypothetical protein